MKKTTALFIALALVLGLCACSATATWQEQYDLGVRYLSEGNYWEAIIAFNAAIEIDLKRADAYIGLSDAYEAQGNTEQARQVLADALAVVANPDMIQNRLGGLGESAVPAPTPTPAPEPTPEPTPVAAVIASGQCGENLTWTLEENGTLTISGTGAMTNYDYDSSAHVPWADQRRAITTIVINSGATSIGNWIFNWCDYLTSVTIPDSVTSIGEFAFLSCGILTDVAIPSSVTSIGRNAFQDCNSLAAVTIPDSVTNIGVAAFISCESLTDVYYGGTPEQWGQIAFDGNGGWLRDVTIHYTS